MPREVSYGWLVDPSSCINVNRIDDFVQGLSVFLALLLCLILSGRCE